MNNSPEITAKAEPMSMHSARPSLKDLSVAADYDITLKLSDCSATKSSECLHHLKGTSRHSLVNLMAIGGLMVAGAAAILCLVNMLCNLVCCHR